MLLQKAQVSKGNGMATKHLRSVFDTNIYLSTILSKNAHSPSRELFARLQNQEFTLITCAQILEEVVEKLVAKKINPQLILDFIADVIAHAQSINISGEIIPPAIVDDPDDDIIVACALQGNAEMIVTYDRHFASLPLIYPHLQILTELAFLQKVRISLNNNDHENRR